MIEPIIIPYVDKQRKKSSFPVSCIVNNGRFQCQMTDEVKDLFQENYIIH